jgi:DNA-binding NarL/FixJ family response regulator
MTKDNWCKARCPSTMAYVQMYPAGPVNLQANPSDKTVKILIADDHQLVREGLKLLIGQLDAGLSFVEAKDYASLRAQLLAHPELAAAVVDLHMPGSEQGDGLQAVAKAHPHLPLVIVSAYSSPDVVRKALMLSTVYAFVPKNGSAACMHTALKAALARDKIGEVSDAAPEAARSPDLLAPRLAAVRELLREGKSNKVIAHELGLSEGTVKNYMSEIFKSLKVNNRTQAARFDE